MDVTPILNVSDLEASFAWFAKLGWSKSWEWCPPDATAPVFGAVASGDREIFLCLNDQGGRGEQGAWLSIWCDDASDVDRLHATCTEEGFEVIDRPEDKPWGVREMHLRHPDGHVLRIGADSPHEP